MTIFAKRIKAFGAVLATLALAACSDSDSPGASTVVTKSVQLNGSLENPVVTTAATGTGIVAVDTATGAVSGFLTTFGATVTAAHIHQAAVGTNGPVIVPMSQDAAGVWRVGEGATLTAAQIEAFQAGNLYYNFHTAANPSGEARGQFGRTVYFATLTGAQEAPAVTTTASGSGRFIHDPAAHTLSGTVTTTGVTGTAAHLHLGNVGVAGPVTIPLTGGPANWTLATTALTEIQEQALLGGSLYANVHSAANPGGEIRGQLFFPARAAILDGASEVPVVATAARGTGWMFVNPVTRDIAIRIETTGITATAAHAHRGAPGVAGPVVIPLTQNPPGVWASAAGATISDDLLASFLRGELYLNVHSAQYPGGEIRGQLLPPL
jgi:hypothetical protein